MMKKRIFCLCLAVLLLMSCLAGCKQNSGDEQRPSGNSTLSDLANKKVGVVTGSIQAIMLPDMVPDAIYLEFNNYADVITAFHSNKIDAFSTDESIYKAMLWEGQKVNRITEALSLSDYGLIFGKGQSLQLQQQINEYIAKIKDNGTHRVLEQKWFGDSEPTQFESYSDLSTAGKVLRVGISSASKPFVYEKNGMYAGFEVEFIIGFCREYGYGVTFEDTAFSGIMAGVAAGKYDIGMSGITITDERKESMDFSVPLHTEDLVLVVKGQATAAEKKTPADFLPVYTAEDHKMIIDIWQMLTLFPGSKSYNLRTVACREGEYKPSRPVCPGNRAMVAVSANGNVFPCMQMSGYYEARNDILGNVKQSGLQPLLQMGRYLAEVCATVGELAETNAACRDCPYFKHCAGGCRAVALTLTSDKMGVDLSKCLFFKRGYYEKTVAVMDTWRNNTPIVIAPSQN